MRFDLTAILTRLPVLPVAALAGAMTVAGFAPFYLFPVPVVTLAVLIVLWQRASGTRRAALIGFCFGLGFFLTGVSWIYVSLHTFGMMPAPLAAVMTLLFCLILACYPAICGWLYSIAGTQSMFITLAVLPAFWTLTEWTRGWLFTGFPWLALGDAQVPHSPLAGFGPVLGTYGTTYLTVMTAAMLVLAFQSPQSFRQRAQYSAIVLVVWVSGFLLKHFEWTNPVGAPVKVSLLQGNIAQEVKWRPDEIKATLDTYVELAEKTDAQLIVTPETALPLFLHDLPVSYLARLAAHVRSNHGDILVGVPERTDARDYYNSVLSFGIAPTQTYRKSHLVPFGEFVPLKPLFGWFLEVTNIPLLDFTRGTETPKPLAVAGQRIAVNICYEDAFGGEIIRQLPDATLLVNVSNVAWFGRSLAPMQHLQISQARALETGRYMLRATNTGMTAIIDQHGRVRDVAPGYTKAVVTGTAQGYEGATPYVRWGNGLIIAISLALACIGGWLRSRDASRIRSL